MHTKLKEDIIIPSTAGNIEERCTEKEYCGASVEDSYVPYPAMQTHVQEFNFVPWPSVIERCTGILCKAVEGKK